MANDLTFGDLSVVLNSIVSQATGKEQITPTNTSDFVAVGQVGLKTGYDPLMTAISQVLSKTVFSTRPYTAKFKGLRVSSQKFGNITRKLNIVDKDFEKDKRFDLQDGVSCDMFKVHKPELLQTNFYGANTFAKCVTIYKDQLDCAFNSPDEFASFISMVLTNSSDLIEQGHENLGRATIANFIGGKVLGDVPSCVHLLTEYNAVTGLTLTDKTVYTPENFAPFMKWVFARVAELSDLMTERSQLFQIQVTGKPISRHSPLTRQKVYLFSPAQHQIQSRVLADAYHDNYLKYADNERVNFWQSIKDRASINVKPTYLKPDGTLITPEEATVVHNIFGVIFDEEAAGYTTVNQWSQPTPFEAEGGYSNIWWHYTDRYWNDFTEKGIVLLLD